MRERGIARYQFLIWSARRRRRCLRFSDPTTARSWCSTTTAICGVLRRGAAKLMGDVDDAPTARRIALMLGERPMWWSPEKDAGTKNAGQSGQGCETGRTKVRFPAMAVPRITALPRAWAGCGIALWSKILSTRGGGAAVSKNMEKWQDGRLLRHLGGSCGPKNLAESCWRHFDDARKDASFR